MSHPKINLLREKYHLHHPRKKSRLGRVVITLTLALAVAASVFSYRVSPSGEGGTGFTRPTLLSTIHKLVRSEDRTVMGEEKDRVNFLFLGVGGTGHEGPQLSDTMIFGSLKPSTNDVGLISLPRDLVVPIKGYGWRKINHANAYGEIEKPGSGPQLASQIIEEITGQKVHYYVRVDFNGFAEMIDDLGGVDVYVERAFTDAQYPVLGAETAECGDAEVSEELSAEDGPTSGGEEDTTPTTNYSCRFETIAFEQGWEQMDGERALKFVRSRHGTNGESSDFARSRRQQQVLMAVKDRVLSAGTYLNPAKISRILETLDTHVATNLSTWELLSLANRLGNIRQDDITMHVLEPSETSPIYATFFNGAYVLLPKNDDWKLLQALAQNVFEPTLQDAYARTDLPDRPKFVNVEIQNGTQVSGLAFHISQMLDGQGFDVQKIGNAAERQYDHTVIYDLSNGRHPDALKELRDFLKADVTLSAAGWMVTGDIVPKEIHLSPDEFNSLVTGENIDFLVILGDSSASLVRK